MRIESFQGEWRFLSNFWEAPTLFEGVLYPTSEHAYQAAKTENRVLRAKIKNCATPGKAKRLGAEIAWRDNWDDMKVGIMEQIVRSKFKLNADIRDKLKATGNAELREGNRWHDNFWGDCFCDDCADIIGQNHLGRILMKIREELR